MNREIKFRYWNGIKMQITDFHITCFGIVWNDTDSRDGSDESRILMQYTGLKDKNGVEIYEGDIITFSTRRYHFGIDKGLQTIKFKSVVVWEEGGFMVSENQENDTFLCAHHGSTDNPNGYEVVGNIHQHSHLLVF